MIMNVCEMWWLYFIMIYVPTPYYVLSSQFESILLLIILLFSSSYQFVLLNVEACHFGDIYCDQKNFIWHLLIIIPPFSIPSNQSF